MAPWLIDPKVISIEYGDKEVTDEKVFARFRDAIKRFQPITINNDNLGGDPQPGVQKTCTVTYSLFLGYYEQYRQQRRSIPESSVMDFSWTLVDLTWGRAHPDQDPDVARFVERPDVYHRIYDAVNAGAPFPVTCQFLGCDPAFGVGKVLRLLYVSPQGKNVIRLLEEGEECVM